MSKHPGIGGVTPPAALGSAQHYETPACATRALIAAEGSNLPHFIWEPCAGKGAISRVLWEAGHEVLASDLLAYPGADPDVCAPVDFLLQTKPAPSFGSATIVSNFPFTENDDMIEHGLDLGYRVICLMRLAWQEGNDGIVRGSGLRSKLVDRHLTHIWLGKERLPMMHREGYEGKKLTRGAVPYAWFSFSPIAHDPAQGYVTRRISWGAIGLTKP